MVKISKIIELKNKIAEKRTLGKKINPKYLFMLFTGLFVFLFEMIGTYGITSITNNSSEFNVIAMAADLAGYQWKDTILKEYYYGFPSSVLFSLLFRIPLFTNNSSILLHGLLGINVLINSLCAIALFLIICKIIEHNSWEINYFFVSVCTLACSLFLSSQVLTKGVTNENVLCLSFILCFLVITYGIDQKKKVLHIINAFLLAFLCIVGYMTNGRGLILCALVFLLVVSSYIFKSKRFCSVIVFIISLGAFYLLGKYVKSIFVNTFFLTDAPLKNNDTSGIVSRFISLLNFQGIKLYLCLCIGWFEYFFVSTYGLGIISIYASIRIIVGKIKNKENISDSLFYAALFNLLFLAMISVLGISFYHDSFNSMFFNPEDDLSDGRVDKLVYGRYISTIKPLSIGIAFIYLKYFKTDKRKEECIGFILTYFSLALMFFRYIVTVLVEKKYAAVDIPEFALFFGNYEKNYKFGFIEGQESIIILIKITFLLFIILLLLALKNKIMLVATLCLLFNILFGIQMDHQLIYPRSEYYSSVVDHDFIDYVNVKQSSEDGEVVIVDKNAYLYQFNMPRKHVLSYAQIKPEYMKKVSSCIILNSINSQKAYKNTLNDVLDYISEDKVLIWEEKDINDN